MMRARRWGLPRRVRGATVLIGAVVAMLAATAVPASAAGPDPGHAGSGVIGLGSAFVRVQTAGCVNGPVGRRVLVVGDSITVFTQATLERRLAAAGWSVCLDARRSETTAGALDNYAATGAFPAYVDVVVMATGTNDALDPTGFVAQVTRARAYATGRPLLWFTTWMRPTGLPAATAARYLAGSHRINAVIWKQVDRARRGSVVDWHATIDAGRSRAAAFLRDGVHTTELGGRQRTALLVAALRPLQR